MPAFFTYLMHLAPHCYSRSLKRHPYANGHLDMPVAIYQGEVRGIAGFRLPQRNNRVSNSRRDVLFTKLKTLKLMTNKMQRAFERDNQTKAQLLRREFTLLLIDCKTIEQELYGTTLQLVVVEIVTPGIPGSDPDDDDLANEATRLDEEGQEKNNIRREEEVEEALTSEI